ncbi:MAG: hypothetical protein A3G47_02780 [Candidatus Zambryskibacteria bacterium RIFCSPLOWO2_12_FULL_39_45]|uniref:DUF397 domain-containing protein n=3 Tax=Candidatus Zambryskiibacteriota TaxID=1817925 RepID=A0A1G2TBY6_9BACT|nr:MAG: hypothetical protein UT81_C0021G0020 [Parcubacteria group bacterium GW2011_GWA2_40_14]OHA94111.1 MAG: hypothetical protein A2W58_00630 [Candidatus Zambryskibacteria bacterium RIFCSPHIGHO2_02_38_10.5]OHA96044.1 MAG: hypothetical protein A3C63_01890 [Candidatus Zambryskibacteria bacterium RIFCSPHIGHO2_02_FULL_39_82]OHA99426.1 MAG: hypothetical protein A3E32_00635 [Candidatus Zambryskibacteria bacterium RIFCSPHIGHO2_12_FULL_38_37]OHB07399.1 MAG: hypothetical protein A2W64_03230 [Candidatus
MKASAKPQVPKRLLGRIDEDGFRVSSLTFIKDKYRSCVAVKMRKGKIQVRDTKDPSKTTLAYTPAEWKAFIDGVKGGEFDL